MEVSSLPLGYVLCAVKGTCVPGKMNQHDVSSYLTLVVMVPFPIAPFPFYLLDKLTPLVKSNCYLPINLFVLNHSLL